MNIQLCLEELHPILRDILDSDEYPADARYDQFLKNARRLDRAGIDTGLVNSRPKKGSSRAVFFPSEHPKIMLDGQEVELPTVHKLAIYGILDRYKEPDEPLLGEDQNRIEGDDWVNDKYGILRRNKNNDGWVTNDDEGILPPLISVHPDYHHLEFGRASKMTRTKFLKLTKNPDYPKGISYDSFYHVLNNAMADAHGEDRPFDFYPANMYDSIVEHPFVSSVYNMLCHTDIHPGDLCLHNMGIWEHPITKKQYPVIIDNGFSREIGARYNELRKRHMNAMINAHRRQELTDDLKKGHFLVDDIGDAKEQGYWDEKVHQPLLDAIANNPDSISAHTKLAKVHANGIDIGQTAINAIANHPKSKIAHAILAEAHKEGRDIGQKAIDAIANHPKSTGAHNFLAMAHMKGRNIGQDAINAIANHPESTDAHYFLALAHKNEINIDQAAINAIANNPESTMAHMCLAEAHKKGRNIGQDAINAIANNPESTMAHTRLADAHKAERDIGDANYTKLLSYRS